MNAVDAVQRWFDAFAAGDMDAARDILSADAVLHAERDYVGFDEFQRFYAAKREHEGTAFSWALLTLDGRGDMAAAMLGLRNEAAEWTQVAVYRVSADHIVEMWFHEGARG